MDPADAYRTCTARGMDMVALTDHNTISGAVEIAHHPDVIVGRRSRPASPTSR